MNGAGFSWKDKTYTQITVITGWQGEKGGIHHKIVLDRTCLVVQWLGIRLPMQGTRVWALVQEDPTHCRAAKPERHNYWACALEPASHNCWARMPQLLKPTCLEPVLGNKRSHLNEEPVHRNKEWTPLTTTRESPRTATKTQRSQK